MLRLLKFAAVFLGVTFLIFFLVFGLNKTAFQTLFDNRHAIAEGSEWVEKTYSLRGLTEYIGEHPDNVSIVSINLDRSNESIRFRETTPRPMGMTSAFITLIAYADAFERDEIDPGQSVEWEHVEQFQLPGTGGPQLQDARRHAREEGYSREGRISIENLVSLLPRYNSPAIHDFLLDHLGLEQIDHLLDRLELTETERPAPISGLLLTLSPAIQQIDAATVLEYWQEESRDYFLEESWANSHAYAYGDRRSEWLDRLEANQLGHDYFQQRDLLRLFPATTANEMADLLKQVFQGELISSEVSSAVTDWIESARSDSATRRHFTRYGGLFDTRMGLLNGIDYGTTERDGDTHVQAIFFDTIQIAVWFHMSSNHMNQDFQRRLMWDPMLRQATRDAIQQQTL